MSHSDPVLDHARQLQDDTIGFLRDIVAIPSLSSSEEKVARRIAAEMEMLGYD